MLYDQPITKKESILYNHDKALREAANVGKQAINAAQVTKLQEQLDAAKKVGQYEGLAAGKQMYAQVNPELQYYMQRAEQDYNNTHQPVLSAPVQEQPLVDHTRFNEPRDSALQAEAIYNAEHGLAARGNN